MMHARSANAFTLIELLIVIGVISLLASATGLSLREGRPAAALQSAQGTVASLLSAARGQAALSQRRTILIVEGDSRREGFLRDIRIAIETGQDSGQWVLNGEGAVLPTGIYVVPGPMPPAGATLNSATGAWPAGRLSSLQPAAAGSILSRERGPAGVYLQMSQPFGLAGTMRASGGDKWVLSPARRAPDKLIFTNPDWVRGVVLSSYGLAILINDGPGFDF
jgi:prepilin-type N-terminal cleavage/methylation domain-containing protein